MSRKAVFLDRDGVLIRARVCDGRPLPPACAAEVEILPGVKDACAALHEAGFVLVVITNQPDIARGTTTEAHVEAMNQELRRVLEIDDVVVCSHDDADKCGCRKPAPGMLIEAADRWAVDLKQSVVVGDRWRDVEAGQRAGVHTVFIDHGYREAQPVAQELTVGSLTEAVPWILARCGADPEVCA